MIVIPKSSKMKRLFGNKQLFVLYAQKVNGELHYRFKHKGYTYPASEFEIMEDLV